MQVKSYTGCLVCKCSNYNQALKRTLIFTFSAIYSPLPQYVSREITYHLAVIEREITLSMLKFMDFFSSCWDFKMFSTWGVSFFFFFLKKENHSLSKFRRPSQWFLTVRWLKKENGITKIFSKNNERNFSLSVNLGKGKLYSIYHLI